jgi:hypothetical protein
MRTCTIVVVAAMSYSVTRTVDVVTSEVPCGGQSALSLGTTGRLRFRIAMDFVLAQNWKLELTNLLRATEAVRR